MTNHVKSAKDAFGFAAGGIIGSIVNSAATVTIAHNPTAVKIFASTAAVAGVFSAIALFKGLYHQASVEEELKKNIAPAPSI